MDDSQFEADIIVGTYEDYVVGYRLGTFLARNNEVSAKKKKTNGSRLSYLLDQSFAVRAHSGSVRSLACNASGSLAFSAGFDEMTNLFNLSKRKLLQTSEGAINCAKFVKDNHLICGSEDSNIYIHECRGSSINLVKTLKGHKAAIISIDVHPSGKVLLSVSKDNTLRTWNLIKGRCAYVTNIRFQAHIVKWSKSGDEFVIAVDNEFHLYNNLGKLSKSFKLKKRVNSIEFINDTFLVVAIDSGALQFFNLKDGEESTPCKVLGAHETRIKSIRCLSANCEKQSDDAKQDKEHPVKLVSASSDGVVKVWSISASEIFISDPKEVATTDLGARLTCLEATTRSNTL